MIDILIFVCGVVVGTVGLYALQCLYNWVDSLSRKVADLRRQHSGIIQDIDLWYEFNDWKRMNKKSKE